MRATRPLNKSNDSRRIPATKDRRGGEEEKTGTKKLQRNEKEKRKSLCLRLVSREIGLAGAARVFLSRSVPVERGRTRFLVYFGIKRFSRASVGYYLSGSSGRANNVERVDRRRTKLRGPRYVVGRPKAGNSTYFSPGYRGRRREKETGRRWEASRKGDAGGEWVEIGKPRSRKHFST